MRPVAYAGGFNRLFGFDGRIFKECDGYCWSSADGRNESYVRGGEETKWQWSPRHQESKREESEMEFMTSSIPSCSWKWSLT
ncbi:hypothetical protein MTR_3g452430 [Medicago truncatula]|uniref:Uncharacterized protein n=1 Tax=Medicago truncatula TaxID=3880 RepID=A0A072UVA8_MEDTR|nr:hypothetical protein MTR_3g452430 [Medicago truncatula]